MKWLVIFLIIGGLGYLILTDNMGGARKATANYAKVMSGK